MTPLILIPGMMCDAHMWGDFPARLGGRRVIHAPCHAADNMTELAEIVLRDAPPFFALAGLSMGGIVAMEVLRQAPERVERLALLDTNPLAETPDVQARRVPQIARALAGDLASVMRDEMKPNYLAPGPGQAAILQLCMEMALSLGAQVFTRQSRALATRPDQQATLGAFTGPALVLMGEADRLCPRARHDLMHSLMPQSRLAVIAQAGHLPILEQPTETKTEILRWLNAD